MYQLAKILDLQHQHVPWGQEFSGGPKSWAQAHLRSSSLIPYSITKTSQVTQHSRNRDLGSGKSTVAPLQGQESACFTPVLKCTIRPTGNKGQEAEELAMCNSPAPVGHRLNVSGVSSAQLGVWVMAGAQKNIVT